MSKKAKTRVKTDAKTDSKTDAKTDGTTYHKIYAVVQKIPPGTVATYGQIAELAGYGGKARLVGYALYRVEPEMDVPWQRVVNAKGEISRSPARYGNDDYQRVLLEAEGIEFDTQDRIDLKRYRWQADEDVWVERP
jgi:methylated-DNA-protein-cysteine methyltransferase related protein